MNEWVLGVGGMILAVESWSDSVPEPLLASRNPHGLCWNRTVIIHFKKLRRTA
jgi:hypothetical protein